MLNQKQINLLNQINVNNQGVPLSCKKIFYNYNRFSIEDTILAIK